jgi:outer membrane protein TolC
VLERERHGVDRREPGWNAVHASRDSALGGDARADARARRVANDRGPHARGWRRAVPLAFVQLALSAACLTPVEARKEADDATYEIIRAERERLFGQTDPFTIETAADTLRRRLLIEQDLPRSDPASLGSKDVEPIEQWPDRGYFESPSGALAPPWAGGGLVTLNLVDALRIGAANSRAYQNQKELVFQAALALDLEDDRFRKTWLGVLTGGLESDGSTDPALNGATASADVGGFQRLKNGGIVAVNLALDLVKLLNGGEDGSLGILGDASISIPLLRGSSRFVVTEPLKQAERDVVYSLYEFERFKRTYAVQIATDFYAVLQLRDEWKNAEDNYRWLIGASRRARRMADAQQLERIELDQTLQDELDARDAWIVAQQAHARRLDAFKLLLGLPVDAEIELDQEELEPLAAIARAPETQGAPEDVPADAPIELVPPGRGGGLMALDPRAAVVLALQNRLDLRVAVGRVFDSQRNVAVSADLLRADLNLFGRATLGDRRTLGDATLEGADPQLDEGRYSATALLGLPFERTAERNVYRSSLIDFERAVRGVQELEDNVKLQVREDLRVLHESRERVRIQARSVRLAEQRVESTSRFLEVGRAESRDVLEAQSDLVDAKNELSLELVRYRLAELALQRDLDLLRVDEKGLWAEVDPEDLLRGGN